MNKEKLEKLEMYLTVLNGENPSHVKENAKTNIIKLFKKQQKERANMTQIFKQAVVNEVIKVLDEILGE